MYRFVLTLACLFFIGTAHAYINTPFITPASPYAGETLYVNVDSGVCDAIVAEPGYPQVSVDGSSVRVVLLALRYTDIELCNLPSGVGVVPIGALPAGSYQITVDVFYYDGFGNPRNDTIGVLPLIVQAAAAPPLSVPSATTPGLTLLAALLGGAAIWRQRRSGLGLIAALLIGQARAETHIPQQDDGNQTIEVLLSSSSGAPSAEQVLAYIQSPVGAPPLEALRTLGPQRASFMLPQRAEGALLTAIRENPESPRAKLERYIVVNVATPEVELLLAHLTADPYVETAYLSREFEPSSVTTGAFSVTTDDSGGQTQIDQLNIYRAWATSTGNALIMSVDTGTYPSHPALQQFSGSAYAGGNFVSAVSLDFGVTGYSTPSGFLKEDVDEAKKVDNQTAPCPTGLQRPVNAGHGTHTSGIMVANVASGQGLQGACKHCGLGIEKMTRAFCVLSDSQIHLQVNNAAYAPALTSAVDQGAQIINMSWGIEETTGNNDYCYYHPSDAVCLAVAYAASRDVAMIASSGNNRTRLQSPASSPQVVGVGGIDSTGAFWDESPGTNTNCPTAPSGAQCGSNYTPIAPLPQQELVADAKSVWSTTYPNKDWTTTFRCGDHFPGPAAGNGVGQCTGTSMSAPVVSGVMGILRSINPLVLKGAPSPATGLRGVLASTTQEAQASLPWDSKLGYGKPDAEAAAKKLIGTVGGRVTRNRATPLFRMYSTSFSDYVDTTSPQFALSLMNSKGGWGADAGTKDVPNYYLPGESVFAKASMYVLTTQYQPRPIWPALVPLYMMRKSYSGSHIDYLMATTKAELQTANTAGYSLLNIQGYVYKACSPDCIPPGAEKLWRKYRSAINDCAVFLENERTTFEAAGYTAACPAGSSTLLGYAYPAGADTDSDGLPDGFEYVVGTDPTRADSDGDGSTHNDGNEFPMAGVPVSDPCSGGTYGATYCYVNDVIFKDGMEAL